MSEENINTLNTTINSTNNTRNNEDDDALAAVAATTSNHVYIHSTEHGWIPARVLEMQDDGKKAKVSVPIYRSEAAIQSDGGKKAKTFETRVVDLNEYTNKTLLLQNVDEDGRLNQVEDMVDLPFLHEVRCCHQQKKYDLEIHTCVCVCSSRPLVCSCRVHAVF